MKKFERKDEDEADILNEKIRQLKLEYDISPKDLMEDELAYYYPTHNYKTGEFEDYEVLIPKVGVEIEIEARRLTQTRN